MRNSRLLLSTLAMTLAGCSAFDEQNSCPGTITIDNPSSLQDNQNNPVSPITPNAFNEYSFEGDIVDVKSTSGLGASRTVLMTMPSGDQTLYIIRGTAADYRRLDVQDSAFLAEPKYGTKLGVTRSGAVVVAEGFQSFEFVNIPLNQKGFQGKVDWSRVVCDQRFTDFKFETVIPLNQQSYALGFYRQGHEVGFVTASLSDNSRCTTHRLGETSDMRALKGHSEYHFHSKGVATVSVYGKRYTQKFDDQFMESLYE